MKFKPGDKVWDVRYGVVELEKNKIDDKYPFAILKDDLYESYFDGFTWVPSSSYLYDLNIRDFNDYECLFIEDECITIVNVDNDLVILGSTK